MHFNFQPPNSPDYNVCDLEFFRTLQNATQGHDMNNIEEVVIFITKEFEEMKSQTINDVFISIKNIWRLRYATVVETIMRNRILKRRSGVACGRILAIPWSTKKQK